MPHLQLKDIPAGTHDALRVRASAAGVSMREYVLRLVEADLGRVDTYEEMRERMRGLARARAGAPTGVELLRAAREEREAQLLSRVEPR